MQVMYIFKKYKLKYISFIFLYTEVSDDILAKYRTKPFLENNSMKTQILIDKSSPKVRSIESDVADSLDVNNTFDDIKKKLRLVLSNTTLQTPKAVKVRTLLSFYLYTRVLGHQ